MRGAPFAIACAAIDQRLALVDLDLDQIDDVLGLFLAGGDRGGDAFADKAHDAVGQHRIADRLVVELVQHRA